MPVVLPNLHMSVAWHHIGGSVTGEMVNTCAFDLTSSEEAGPEESLAALSLLWANGPQASHVNQIVYTKATAMFRTGTGALQAYESTAGTIGGSAGTDMMPLNVTMIVEKRTGIAGRKFRGRFHFGGFPLNFCIAGNPNEVDPSQITAQTTIWSAFHSGCVADGLVPVLLHQTGGPAPTQIQTFAPKALVGNMRKRIR